MSQLKEAFYTSLKFLQLKLSKANETLEFEKREFALLLEKRDREINDMNGMITLKFFVQHFKDSITIGFVYHGSVKIIRLLVITNWNFT